MEVSTYIAYAMATFIGGMMRKIIQGVIVASAAASAVGFPAMASAGAATAPSGGPIKVWVRPSPTGTGSKPGKVMFTGAIGDYGTSQRSNATGKKTKKGHYINIKLQKGTILVNTTTLTKAFTGLSKPTTANTANCSFVFHVTAPVPIVKGTGSYSSISGSVTISATDAAIATKKKTGACTMSTSSKPLASYTSIVGVGTVTF
jgi:hypothetical protein